MVAAAFDLGDDPSPARVVLALPGEALEPLPQAPPPDASNERVARTLESVDLELVVELARVPMRLGDVLALRPGDTLPLDLPVGESVSVRADDRTLFRGKPTTLLGRIAVRIEGRHEG
jgi:flagellar motor switch protein FliM